MPVFTAMMYTIDRKIRTPPLISVGTVDPRLVISKNLSRDAWTPMPEHPGVPFSSFPRKV